MQGTLNEIDIRSILQFLELGQRTGTLLVEAPRAAGSARLWTVHLARGQIAYAVERHEDPLQRLRDWLRRDKAESIAPLTEAAVAPSLPPEYAGLWQLLESGTLTPQQSRHILESCIRETLFDLLSLHQGRFRFRAGPALEPPLIALAPSEVTSEIVRNLQHWKQLYPEIQSPAQRPHIVDPECLRGALSDRAYRSLARACNGNLSLRRIARLLNRDLLAMATAVYPYVQCGWVHLDRAAPSEPALDTGVPRAPQILCIDSDAAASERLEGGLKTRGYGVTTIADPLQAIATAVRLQPDAIVCAQSLPRLAGDELCAMLQASPDFARVPTVVALAPGSTYFEWMRVRAAGATEVLLQPVELSAFLALIDRLVADRAR